MGHIRENNLLVSHSFCMRTKICVFFDKGGVFLTLFGSRWSLYFFYFIMLFYLSYLFEVENYIHMSLVPILVLCSHWALFDKPGENPCMRTHKRSSVGVAGVVWAAVGVSLQPSSQASCTISS